MKKWKILSNFKFQISNFKLESLIKTLLKNRGIRTKREIDEFLNPQLSHVTSSHVAIDKKHLKRAVQRIKRAIEDQEQIVVFGDYDVDGICGTAILWETLNGLGARVLPYIPHRIDEGYGLSTKGITNVKLQMSDVKLILTVDNGIVANEAVAFANKNGIDVIITDHHVPGKKRPKAHAIVHTTKLCGAGVAWALAQELKVEGRSDDHLALVALATIADLVALTGANRVLTKYGLEILRKTKRLGIVALCEEAGIEQSSIDMYEVGHIIAPRLNAMGRLEYAMDSLRLLCTKDQKRAHLLAQTLGATNRQRQLLTEETVLHAVAGIRNQESQLRQGSAGRAGIKKLLFVAHESYQQGVIGLVAGKLVEEFYRPAIVVSIGEQYSKASARSVHGFNIIEFIRSASEFLLDAGGHPMAAGFTVETAKLTLLQKTLEEKIKLQLEDGLLTRSLRIDCELPLSRITKDLYEAIQKLAPFGMGNPMPTFMSRKVIIEDMRVVGNDGKHLKLRLQQTTFDAIAFGMGERVGEFHIGDRVDIVYTIDQDVWNGNSRLQLKIKDLRIHE